MSRQDRIREVIRQLKIVREDRGLSLQRILDMVLDAGGNLSMGTVRRVFEDGSEERNFRYEDSIKPIADVLLNVQSSGEPGTEEAAELEALRALVRYKNAYIAELEASASNVEGKVQAARDEQMRKIDFLRAELDKRDEQLRAKDQQIQDRGKLLDERRDFLYAKDRAIRGRNWIIAALVAALAACLAVIILALIIDKANPEVGFFWMDGVKSVFGLTTAPGFQGGVML